MADRHPGVEMHSSPAADPPHVVIAGGGFAALEAAVAVRALVEDRVRLTLIAPGPHFRYRPAATTEAFGGDPPLVYNLARLVRGLRGRHRPDRLAAVVPRVRSLRLGSGRWLSYDHLILAVGAHSRPAIPGALTFRDQRDVPELRALLDSVAGRTRSRLIFAIPSVRSWPLPAYELALLSATQLGAEGRSVDITVVSPERTPLEVFGSEASGLVSDLLSSHDVRFVGGVSPRRMRRGVLELEFDAPLHADAVIAVPELLGHRIAGVPARWGGFIPTDHLGRVEGLDAVYAIGDATTFPVKQGGLATQQADSVAQTIAGQLGVQVHEIRSPRVLQARLLGGARPLFLRTELDEFGQPAAPTIERFESGEAPSQAKVQSRYLGPYLERHEPDSVRQVA